MSKKKGFTLIELLSVIVILAIIALIAVPVIVNIINKANKSAFKDSVYGIIKASELYYATEDIVNDFSEEKEFTFPNDVEELELKGKLPTGGTLKIKEDGTLTFALTNGRYCARYGIEDKDVIVSEEEDCYMYKEEILNGADPVLKEGMIPVTIEPAGTVKKVHSTSKWYSYEEKMWANAITVKEEVREKYKNASVGTVIAEEDILTYFVWIPRYKYELWYVEASDGYTERDPSKVHSINIVFENNTTNKSDGTCNGTNDKPSNGCYLTHPAFTFGEEEVNGIWVGKFETGYSGAANKEEAQKTEIDSNKVIIKPNVHSWRYNTVSNMFYTALNMNKEYNVFGLTTESDTHMMKNTEWGMVAYLAYSDYGKDSEVYINNNNNYLTSCGGDTANQSERGTCLNSYGTKEDDVYNQSTTGNISGIFDMSGGANEYMMGGQTTTANDEIKQLSGFTDETFPEDKYIDKYLGGGKYSSRILGDGTGEFGPFEDTDSIHLKYNSWYDGNAVMINGWNPFFVRGGNYYQSTSDISLFALNSGQSFNGNSFRIVIS